MKLKTGNMWSRFGEVDLFCITINGTFKADGSLVMGAGIAKELARRIPNTPKDAACQLKLYYEKAPNAFPTCYTSDQLVGLFQVKHHWKEVASKELIKRSMVQLFRYIANYPKVTVCLNFPGIGNGKLRRDEVLPIVELLPDNVEVWEYDNQT